MARSPENSPRLTAKILEKLKVTGRKERRNKKKEIEMARIKREQAYVEFGGITGRDVDIIQMGAVLDAERKLIELHVSDLGQARREQLGRSGFDSDNGWDGMADFFYSRAKDFELNISIKKSLGRDEDAREAERIQTACKRAMNIALSNGGWHR